MNRYLKCLFAMSLFIIFCLNKARAQNEPHKDFERSVGIGLGLDYGGIGVNFLGYPSNHLGAFLGLGYNIIGLGYNAGLKYRFNNENSKPHSTSFYALAMYGYVAAMKVTDSYNNTTVYQKTYYGPTFGLGFDRRGSQYSKGYWSFALLLPIRNSEYQNAIDYYKPQIKPLPVAVSIGYRYFL